jgi:uncharacterized membrane protein YfcA
MIHSNTKFSLLLALTGGYLAGALPNPASQFLFLLSVGLVSFYMAPDTETVAVQWREREGLEGSQ